MKDWRRAFTRLTAHILNASIGTSLDIGDASPRVDDELSDKEIRFLFELSQSESNLLEEFSDAIKPIEESLEMKASIFIKSRRMEIIFRDPNS